MKTLFFIFPITGPNNGVKVISDLIKNAIFSNDKSITVSVIDTSQAVDFSSFGKFSVKKVFYFFKLFKQLFTIKRTDMVYMNITPKGYAFYRDFITLVLCSLKTTNITAHIHANGLEKKIKKYNKFLFYKPKIIVINVDQKHKLDILGLRTFLVPNSLPDYFKAKPKTAGSTEELNLIYLSNVSKEKGAYRLKRIAEIISVAKIKCNLNVYGGIMSEDVRDIINELDRKYIFFRYHGVISEDKEKYDCLSRNDVLLFLSNEKYEVYPLVYIEALMAGLSIITTNQIVSNDLMNYGAANILNENTENFESIITKFVDAPQLLEKQKENARIAYQENYSFPHFIKSIENIILYGI